MARIEGIVALVTGGGGTIGRGVCVITPSDDTIVAGADQFPADKNTGPQNLRH